LTVVREMAEEGEKPDVRALPKTEFLRRVVARGEEAVARTPELLAVLKDAGVVDAGGAGLLEITRGLAAGAAGETVPDAVVEPAGDSRHPDPGDGGRRRRRWRGEPATLRELRRHAGDRGRADDEPVDRGSRRGDRSDTRDRGDRPAEQRERHPQRGAGRRPRD